MFLRTETIKEKKLIGKTIRMSFTNNKTVDLWSNFMPRRKEISNVNSEFISLEVFDDVSFFSPFDPSKEFNKWACIEVKDYKNVPTEMQTLTIPESLYAVFLHKGPASDGPLTYNYIFGTWLPASEYILDNRPHFAVMGAKYKNNSPDSEEEIWIPIKKK